MTALKSFELKGQKLSFANWISNLSPTETPFTSMTGKEAVTHTKFQWQTDRLSPIRKHSVIEGSDVVWTGDAAECNMIDTYVDTNYTQILRRAFKVSDTVNATANYGRGKEVPYQIEKYATALKRDLEAILLSDQGAVVGDTNTARKTAGFKSLVAKKGEADLDTKAVVHRETLDKDSVSVVDLENMTYNLYLSGSTANTIMYHPKNAAFFSTLQEKHGSTKMFKSDETTFSIHVNKFVDEFGRAYKLVPNRFMPKTEIYFFNPDDFTQMIFRAPMRTELAKEGSFQHWMIEMEVGLRLRDPYAAGVLTIKS